MQKAETPSEKHIKKDHRAQPRPPATKKRKTKYSDPTTPSSVDAAGLPTSNRHSHTEEREGTRKGGDSSNPNVVVPTSSPSTAVNRGGMLSLAVWSNLLKFCDLGLLMTLRSTSLQMNNMFLAQLCSEVGSSDALGYTDHVIPRLTAGLRCRESCVASDYPLEYHLARAAERQLRNKYVSLHEMNDRLEELGAEKKHVGPEEIGTVVSSVREQDESTQQHQEEIFKRCATEWLAFLGDLRRHRYNICHGLFNSYSLRVKGSCFLLPDDTLCVVDEASSALWFYSRQKGGISLFSYDDGCHNDKRREDQNLRAEWYLEKVSYFDEMVSAFYDRYLNAIFVTTKSQVFKLNVVTPRMRRLDCRIQGKQVKIEYSIAKRKLKAPIGISNIVDSLALPSYSWGRMEVLHAVQAVNDYCASAIGPMENESTDERDLIDDVFIVYDNEERTDVLFPRSKTCPFAYSNNIRGVHEAAQREIRASTTSGGASAATSSVVQNTSFHSSESTDADERLTTSPFASPPRPVPSNPGGETRVTNSFVFTTFPRTTLMACIGLGEAHLLVSQLGFTHAGSTEVGLSFDNVKFLSVPRFQKAIAQDIQVIPHCEDAVVDFDHEPSLRSSQIKWIPETAQGDVEESNVLAVCCGAYTNAIMKFKVYRCTVSKAGRCVDSVFQIDTGGNSVLHLKQKWTLSRGYWYFASKNVEPLMQFVSSSYCSPRPWLPCHQEMAGQQVAAGGGEQRSLSRGSSGVEWRPKYDGHPYFSKPFLLKVSLGVLSLVSFSGIAESRVGGVFESDDQRLVINFSERIHSRNAPNTIIEEHMKRYAQLMDNVSAVGISPTNAYFVVSTTSGRLLLLAPDVKWRKLETRDSSSDGSTATKKANSEWNTGEKTVAAAGGHGDADDGTTERQNGFIGFGGSRNYSFFPRHYHSTPVTFSPTEEEVPKSAETSMQVDVNSLFGTKYSEDAALAYIQNTYKSVVEQWEDQIPSEGNDVEERVRTSSFLRLPVYSCFLKVQRHAEGTPVVKEIHLDEWKLTTLNKAMDILVYDMSCLRPSQTSGAPAFKFPAIVPLFSVGLFSKLFRRVSSRSYDRMLLSLFEDTSPQLEWHNGILLVRAIASTVRNNYIVDFSPSFFIPSNCDDQSKERASLPSYVKDGKSHPKAMSSQLFSKMRKLDVVWMKHMTDSISYVTALTQKHEWNATLPRVVSTQEISIGDYYPLDVFSCFSTEQWRTTYDTFAAATADKHFPFDEKKIQPCDPPHFRALKPNYNIFLFEALLQFLAILLVAPYLLLNAFNSSGTATFMPFWGIFPFILPFSLLVVVNVEHGVLRAAFRRRKLFLHRASLFLLLVALPLLFALKNDGILPAQVKWWHISFTAVAASVLSLLGSLWVFFGPERVVISHAQLIVLVCTVTCVLTGVYFDFPSATDPERGILPLGVAFIPVFVCGGLFLIFSLRDLFLYSGCVICCAIVLRFIIIFFLVIFPSILFVVNYSKWWKWRADPENNKQPNCIAPAFIFAADAVVISLFCLDSFLSALIGFCMS